MRLEDNPWEVLIRKKAVSGYKVLSDTFFFPVLSILHWWKTPYRWIMVRAELSLVGHADLHVFHKRRVIIKKYWSEIFDSYVIFCKLRLHLKIGGYSQSSFKIFKWSGTRVALAMIRSLRPISNHTNYFMVCTNYFMVSWFIHLESDNIIVRMDGLYQKCIIC